MSDFILNDPITQAIGARLTEPFTLLDVGCSGGIHPAWRAFGGGLRAFAFDPNIGEIERLRQKEANAAVVYEAAFVGVPDGHPLSEQLAGGKFVRRTPWSRLSVAWTLNARAQITSNAELTALNQWRKTTLADRSIYIPDYLRANAIADVDFVKIDIDGADLIALQSIFDSPLHENILGMLLEVNFHGTAEPDQHTFHNTDRLMRERGFELFDLSVRTYSSRALPWPYAVSVPAQTINGRPFQGDALYVRDISAPETSAFSAGLSIDKLAKVVAIFALSGHPDQAAEVVEAFSARLSERYDVRAILDELTRQIQKPLGSALSHQEYLDAFAANSPMFYPGWRPDGGGGQASRKSKKRGASRKSPWRKLKRILNRLR